MPVVPFDEAAAREVVKRALRLVADFASDDIDGFVFDRFTPYHKKVFCAGVKVYTNAVIRDGDSHYDIRLAQSDLTGKTVGQFIRWLKANRSIAPIKGAYPLPEADLSGGDL